MKKNTKIAKILLPHNVSSISEYKEPENKIETNSEENPEKLEKFISDYKISLSPDLKPEERRKLMNLLFEFRDIFARNMTDIKTFQGYQVDLIPKNPNPNVTSYTRQYKLRQDEVDEADRQIRELEAGGLVVENDDCRFSSPAFLVKNEMGR